MKNFLLHRYRQIRRVGPLAACRLAWDRLARIADSSLRQGCARIRPTGLSTWPDEKAPRRLVPLLTLPWDGAHEAWLAHRFDLLGSGPQVLDLRLKEPLSDLPGSWQPRFRRLAAMLPAGYRLMDWQVDVKSGHRWSAKQWHRTVTYGHLDGVDVKWPWEFSRLQHLPPLAGRISAAPAEQRSRLAAEIQAQIVDFVMQNPPGFGVNWVCAMDVGIRAANLVLAVDIARAAGEDYDEPFLALVSATLRDHGRFIARNLEWGVSLCSNHYLADVVGLLFVAAYLDPDEETLSWLSFSGREVVMQLRGQFHPAGTNFEASTCYHRLSADMMVFGAAVMLHLCDRYSKEVEGWWTGPVPDFHPPPSALPVTGGTSATGVRVPFDQALIVRLWGMGIFTESIMRSDGSIPIIGDDDSGRFMRIGYAVDSVGDLRSHTELPTQVAALFARVESPDLISRWLRDLVGGGALPVPSVQSRLDPRAPVLIFQDFGLYIWNRSGYRVVFRCGPVGQNGNGGHAHSDQLAFCLDWKGRPVFIDPGTGLYTPDPTLRNRLRSAGAHNTISVPGYEPNAWLEGRWGLFSMKDKSNAEVLNISEDHVEASHTGFGTAIYRRIEIKEQQLTITDRVPAELTSAVSRLILASGVRAVREEGGYRLYFADDPASHLRLRLQGDWLEGSADWSAGYGYTAQTLTLTGPPGCIQIFHHG